jgi:hypothetical protein
MVVHWKHWTALWVVRYGICRIAWPGSFLRRRSKEFKHGASPRIAKTRHMGGLFTASKHPKKLPNYFLSADVSSAAAAVSASTLPAGIEAVAIVALSWPP